MGRDPVGGPQHHGARCDLGPLTMLSHYGTMSFRQVVESALGFARDGFPAYQLLHRTIGSPDRLANLQKYRTRRGSICPTASPRHWAACSSQPDLARTLTLMVAAEQQALGRASHGQLCRPPAMCFTREMARRMVQALHDLVGCTHEDFAEYTPALEEPLSTTYRGYELFTNRTWSQGITCCRR